jgi:hypothetical protein
MTTTGKDMHKSLDTHARTLQAQSGQIIDSPACRRRNSAWAPTAAIPL